MKTRVAQLVLVATVFCPQNVRAEFALNSADRVVFFGDTLTQAQGFSRYVETFVRVKYPQLRTRFFNYGLPGQTAADGLRRLDADLEPLSPTVVVVVFGLYDPERQAFDDGRLTEFRKHYVGIVEGVNKLGAKLVLLTPPRPAATHLRTLPDVDYAEVVGHYAQVVREIGARYKVPVVDWFAGSSELYAGRMAKRPARRQREELLPARLFHAALAAELLKLWRAEPIEMAIEVDWKGEASVSLGEIKIAERTAQSLAVELKGIPLPWDLRGVSLNQLQAADWPGAEMCNYVLKMRNIPEAGVELLIGGRGIPIERDQLRTGTNITGWRPIQSQNPALSNLRRAMLEKHRFRFDLWQKMPQRRPKEPELQEAFEQHLKTLQLYEEGNEQIIFRLPKTFDVVLSFRERPQEQPPTRNPKEQTRE